MVKRDRCWLWLERPGLQSTARCNSADSRVSLRSGGVGLLPVDNLVGRADAVLGSWDLGIRHQPVWTWLAGLRFDRFFTSVR